ncbi:TIGR01440 family protein [Alkalicoccus saliphilus]|uniref:UPF0340 protein C6Y45_11990 n=1 Tax=Alkalicoccus saliphilus TaxID=200989 RepID=A0A2T4U4M9_9BACI|nr:TIGR01440 family protein [Alkalicoccus saliphilus]PTL38360.1 TIGR01440 family protein [Alkalicoccus saliphilus]
MAKLKEDLSRALDELQEKAHLEAGELFIIGTSTSEVIGEHIGKAGTTEVAELLWDAFSDFQKKTGVHLAFQCCEHLNRAVMIEKETADKYGMEIVNARPVPEAGGSMAAYAFGKMQNPVLTEQVAAHAGIDIGDTFIGMHLKRVAIPVRTSIKQIGEAHTTFARTRPKLIGGPRAKYT